MVDENDETKVKQQSGPSTNDGWEAVSKTDAVRKGTSIPRFSYLIFIYIYK